MTTRLLLPPALTTALALALSACGDSDDTSTGVSAQAPTSASEAPASPSETSASTSDDGTSAEADAVTRAAGGGIAEVTAAALAAIGTAEGSAGGTAYEIDDQEEDGTWEVEVAVGDRSVEVTVSPNGSEAISTQEEGLDGDDANALAAARVTLREAIEAAIAQAGGVVDSASLDEEDGTYVYEVELDRTDRVDDLEVSVDALTAQVVATDD